MSKLLKFLTEEMKMREVYQPLIILELLENNGKRSKTDLATIMSRYDFSVLEYQKKVLMGWPTRTLQNHHKIIKYQAKEKMFVLNDGFVDLNNVEKEAEVCRKKIAEWLDRAKKAPGQVKESARLEALKRAKGKCQLCGFPASLRPLDVDHIVPQKRKSKSGKVRNKYGELIDVHSQENLQVLCFKCNRSKQDMDDTDFRPNEKLVRDKIPQIIRSQGREPRIKYLKGEDKLSAALNNKLFEEHEEYIAAKSKEESLNELADMLEVVFALAKCKGVVQKEMMARMLAKRQEKGSFNDGCFYKGDIKQPASARRRKSK